MVSEEQRRREWLSVAAAAAAAPITSLHSACAALSAELERARAAITGLEATSATHTQTCAAIELKLPALEADKKQAAASRDFKTAARVAKEIKDMQTVKQKAGETLQELKAQILGLQTSIQQKTAAKQEIEGCGVPFGGERTGQKSTEACLM